MDSLFQATNNAAAVQRIERLPADAQPLWGRMNAAQMLAHCQKPFLVACGDLKLKRSLIGRLFGGMARKKFIESPAPFKQNLPTDPRFLKSDASDVAREKAELIRLVGRFSDSSVLTDEPHPFFGRLSSENWDRLMCKHLDHHLRQFGV